VTSRRLAPEDLYLWRLVTQSVTRLKEEVSIQPPPPVVAPPDPPPDPPPAGAKAKSKKGRIPAAPPPPSPRKPEPKALVPGKVSDMDRSTADKLRRGRLEIEGRLDLHGMSAAQAQAAVERFIAASHHLGRRCVLIITGKGMRSRAAAPWLRAEEGEDGVLRSGLPRWLNEPALRPLVLAVTPAQPQHGGQGAVYVMLKRFRDPASR
jgi:DNA-nicking Smr family endonuclease